MNIGVLHNRHNGNSTIGSLAVVLQAKVPNDKNQDPSIGKTKESSKLGPAHANSRDILIELPLPLWHQDAKKGEEHTTRPWNHSDSSSSSWNSSSSSSSPEALASSSF